MSSDLTAAIIAGWAVAWAARTLHVPPFGAIVLGLLVGATVLGAYRRRYAPPETI